MDPILLIHGFPLDAAMWQPQVDHLRRGSQAVLAPNLPGFGGTPAPPLQEASIEAFAAGIHRVIAEQAGGYASDGERPILDIQPTALHQRTPLFVGSRGLVEQAERFIGDNADS